MAFIQFIFMGLFLPETCGVPVEEIVQSFAPGNSIIQLDCLRSESEKKENEEGNTIAESATTTEFL